MPYGGPRVEFFLQSHYDNHTAAILKEDAARVAAIQGRRTAEVENRAASTRIQAQRVVEEAQRQRSQAAAEQQAAALRQERLQTERQQAMKDRQRHRLANRHNVSHVIGDDPRAAADRSSSSSSKKKKKCVGQSTEGTRFTGSARVLAMSQPKKVEEPAYGGLMYGRCMHQHSKVVEFPIGRAGEPYMPGVDRDRIVPERPDTSFKPWEGSYSTQRVAAAESKANAASKASLGGMKSSSSTSMDAEARAQRLAMIDAMEAEHMAHSNANTASPARNDFSREENEGGHNDGSDYYRNGVLENGHYNNAEPLPPLSPAASVFSHGSSNGPIVATGTLHMSAEPRAGREQVSLHLSRYGGAMTASAMRSHRNGGGMSTGRSSKNGSRGLSFEENMAQCRAALETLTLPELSHRVVTTQQLAS